MALLGRVLAGLLGRLFLFFSCSASKIRLPFFDSDGSSTRYMTFREEEMQGSKSYSPEFDQLLLQARQGSVDSLGNLLNYFVIYLRRKIRRRLPPRLNSKMGDSDLLQETLLEAFRDFNQFKGERKEELKAWLLRILSHNLSNCYRYYSAKKRNVRRELSLERNSPREDIRAASSTSSEEIREREFADSAKKREQKEVAFKALPDDYQRVLSLRIGKRLGFEDVGKCLGRSSDAARKLFHRACSSFGDAIKKLEQEPAPFEFHPPSPREVKASHIPVP
jgi:RNA polymerase sigma-70 factor, ECF subfamily